MIGDPQECKDSAAKCRELAAHATNPLSHKAYLAVADKWDALAEEISQAKAVLTAINMASATDVSGPSAVPPPGVEWTKPSQSS
jgi:hypothetical protein